jgi:hypothetical protein
MDLKALTCYADVSERTLRDWIHRPTDPLPASQVEGKILVKRSTFDRWMEMHPVKPADSIDVQGLVGDVLAELAVKN